MSTYTQLLYHIVFSTKRRIPWISKKNRRALFHYISGILKHKNCHLYRINGVDDHIHILTHIHPSISVSDLIKDIKLASSYFIKNENLFPRFNGWQEGYSAFTESISEKNRLIQYIKNQELNHYDLSYRDEMINLLNEQGIQIEKDYLI